MGITSKEPMKNKIYIKQDERLEKQTGEIIVHKFVISTFKKCRIGDNIPLKLTINDLDTGKLTKQFVNVVIIGEKGKRYYEGVIK